MSIPKPDLSNQSFHKAPLPRHLHSICSFPPAPCAALLPQSCTPEAPSNPSVFRSSACHSDILSLFHISIYFIYGGMSATSAVPMQNLYHIGSCDFNKRRKLTLSGPKPMLLLLRDLLDHWCECPAHPPQRTTRAGRKERYRSM